MYMVMDGRGWGGVDGGYKVCTWLWTEGNGEDRRWVQGRYIHGYGRKGEIPGDRRCVEGRYEHGYGRKGR